MRKSNSFVLFSLLVLSLVLGLQGTASAQVWQAVFGPLGEDVEGIATGPDGYIYAGTDDGIFFSNDHGASWQHDTSGLTEPEIYSITVTPTTAVLGGTESHGVFRSTDFGYTYTEVNNGIPPNAVIISLACDNKGHVFAGAGNLGVFYSEDDGIHWVSKREGMSDPTAFSLAVSPSGTLYAGTTGFIEMSTDLGDHWTQLKSLAPTEEVIAIALDSAGNIFAGTSKSEVFRSVDHGLNWTLLTVGVHTSAVRGLAAWGRHVYAATYGEGAFASLDGGDTWSPIDSNLTDRQLFNITISRDGFIFVGAYTARVFRTTLPLSSSVKEGPIPRTRLHSYPNPFRASMTIAYTLDRSGSISVELCDVTGRIRYLKRKSLEQSGQHTMTIDGLGLAAGAYELVVIKPAGIETTKIICAAE